MADLVDLGDAKFASRVLRKLFLPNGSFIEQGKDDHRYKGIQNAWIRYVSQGAAALRVIYIKDGETVTMYRAGPHSVEDGLAPPNDQEPIPVLEDPVTRALHSVPGDHSGVSAMAASSAILGLEMGCMAPVSASQEGQDAKASSRRLLNNHVERFLYGNLLGRRFLPHRDVYLMSPYVSLDLLRPTNPFGQMLDELVLEGASVNLITRPPMRAEDFKEFEFLSARKINSFFSNSLHAKVYAFRLDREKLRPDEKKYEDLMVIGSANLTWQGINPVGLLNNKMQYELSYHVPDQDWDDVETFLLHVAHLGVDFDALRAGFTQ